MGLSGSQKQVIITLIMLFVLTGCAGHIERLLPILDDHGAKSIRFDTSYHPLFSIDNQRKPIVDSLWIFIEGDGRAWLSRTTPGTDPTPKQTDLIEKVLSFPEQALYLARPCQFIRSDGCKVAVWTDNRFSEETVLSYHAILDQIKQRHPGVRFNLVGYSGGATIATKLAASRDDVMLLQTIAGNLDPHAWVQWHGYSPIVSTPLSEPEIERLRRVPQRHFTGTSDTVIPTRLTETVIERLDPQCVEIVRIETTHSQWGILSNADILNKMSCLP